MPKRPCNHILLTEKCSESSSRLLHVATGSEELMKDVPDPEQFGAPLVKKHTDQRYYIISKIYQAKRTEVVNT